MTNGVMQTTPERLKRTIDLANAIIRALRQEKAIDTEIMDACLLVFARQAEATVPPEKREGFLAATVEVVESLMECAAKEAAEDAA